MSARVARAELGSRAAAGDPGAVQEIAARLGAAAATESPHEEVGAALHALAERSGSAISVDRLLALLRDLSSCALLVVEVEERWATLLARYADELADLHRQVEVALSELAEADARVAQAKAELAVFEASPHADAQQMFTQAIGRRSAEARDDASNAETRLRVLDDERDLLDAATAHALEEVCTRFHSVRRVLPAAPVVAARTRVTAMMPGGRQVRVSAFGLAAIRDPDEIRRVWLALSRSDRDRLLAEQPLLLGNLAGLPLSDRHTANVMTATATRNELERRLRRLELTGEVFGTTGALSPDATSVRKEIRVINEMLGTRGDLVHQVVRADGKLVERPGVVLVSFDPMRDSFVTYQGPLDERTGEVSERVRHVGIVIPGTGSKLETFGDQIYRTRDLARHSGDDSAYFTWRGGPFPDFTIPRPAEAAQRGFAETAGERLAAFANTMQLPAETEVVPIAHSYGAAVLGRAELLGLAADRVVYAAPAGIGHGATSISDFPRTGNRPHYVVQATNDMVVGWNQGSPVAAGLGIGHGPVNPLTAPGITRLETGQFNTEKPWLGVVEDQGPIAAHSAIFAENSTSLKNMAAVVGGLEYSLEEETAWS